MCLLPRQQGRRHPRHQHRGHPPSMPWMPEMAQGRRQVAGMRAGEPRAHGPLSGQGQRLVRSECLRRQGPPRRRQLGLDRASFHAPQGPPHRPEGGPGRHHPTAELHRGVHRAESAVHRMPGRVPPGQLEESGPGPAARQPQAYLSIFGAAHPQARCPSWLSEHRNLPRRDGLLLPRQGQGRAVHLVPRERRPHQNQGVKEAH
mmetsp:Transcript_25590/g.74024  ORF Transcript_25590/g.74024 Transcript_25590/m.74024 type:complete len:203 (+) Transcript_25590:165-773(+)